MRKILIIVIIILLGIVSYNLVIDGTQIGNYKVAAISEVKAKSDELDQKIDQATEVTTITFNNAVQSLNTALERLSTERQEYEQKIENSSEEEIEYISQKQVHEIEHLWVKIGNYASEENVVPTLEITAGSSGDTRDKDLNFTVTGSYIGITDFLYDLEDDSSLKFKIDRFKLLPDTNNNLKATFVVRDVAVNLNNITTNSEINTTTNTTDQTNNTTSAQQDVTGNNVTQ